MMIRDNEEINVFDVERILGDLPLELIKENITTQVDDPLTYESDYCTEVYEAFAQAENEFGHIETYKQELLEQIDMFNLFLIDHLDKKFMLGIDLNSISDYEAKDMAKNCYNFFIVNLRENIKNFIFNYIVNNKMSLSMLFDEEYKRKDVTTINMKKKFKNKEDVLILSNLLDVINHILNLEFDPVDFVELCSEPEELVADYIKNATSSFIISGNFVPSVLNELKFSHNDTIDEIASSIKLELIEMLNESDFNPDYEG